MGTGETKKRAPIRLTKAEVDALHPEGKDYFVSVKGYKGLTVRVLPNGTRTFVLRYRMPSEGIQRKRVLGEYPAMSLDACKAAHAREWTMIHNGQDPNRAKLESRKAAAEARRAALTVNDLIERYLVEHTPTSSPKWRAESERLIERHIRPSLGAFPLKEVGPGEISSLLFKVGQGTPTQANRIRAVLRTMFGRAEEWGLRNLGTNPVAVVKRRHSETPRERRLSDQELVEVGKALRTCKEAPAVVLGLRLALMAGMRKGEIQGCRWEWIDLQSGTITIPAEEHKTGRKSGRSRTVFLCSAIVKELRALTPTHTCPYLIPGRSRRNADGTPLWSPFSALHQAWTRIRILAGLAEQGDSQEEDPGLHDLRRTFASVGGEQGQYAFVRELLGHAEQSVTDIYRRTSSTVLLEAAEVIGSRIDGLLTSSIGVESV